MEDSDLGRLAAERAEINRQIGAVRIPIREQRPELRALMESFGVLRDALEAAIVAELRRRPGPATVPLPDGSWIGLHLTFDRSSFVEIDPRAKRSSGGVEVHPSHLYRYPNPSDPPKGETP